MGYWGYSARWGRLLATVVTIIPRGVVLSYFCPKIKTGTPCSTERVTFLYTVLESCKLKCKEPRSSPELRQGSSFYALFWSFSLDLVLSCKTWLFIDCLGRK